MGTFGHVAVGLAGARIVAVESQHPRLTQLGYGLLALSPDLDAFTPGLTHKGPMSRTHTPAASLAASGAVALIARRVGLPFRKSFVAALLAVGSQPVFDTGTHGKGVALFWPYSARRYFQRIPGLPTWKPEQGRSRSGWRSFRGELAWALPLLAIAALPIASRAARPRQPSRLAGDGASDPPSPMPGFIMTDAAGSGVAPVLDPRPGLCCIAFQPTGGTGRPP